MAELDTVILHNPLDEDFVQKFNGEDYTLPARSSKAFGKFAAYHVAKHLSTKLIEAEIPEKMKKDRKSAVVLSQRLIYDNPFRRIALYRILNDKLLVQDVIMHYPFKGFVGEMADYERFVANEEKQKESKDSKESKESKESKPKKEIT